MVMRNCTSKYWPIVIAIIFILFLGCTRSLKKDISIGWPPPPQEPVIEYQRSIYGSYNLPRSFLGKVRDFLFGRNPDLDITKPWGLTFDSQGVLYIADTGKKGILILDLQSGKVDFIRSMGAQGKLGEPVNLIFDSNDNLYVADTKLGKIVVFDPDMKFSHFIGSDSILASPVGMAFSQTTQNLYVVDSKYHMVKVFSLQGELINEFGGMGDEQGMFYHPLGIAINDGDTVYIVDSFHFAVQAFDLDGNFLFSFGPTAGGVGTLARPRAIAIDNQGHLYVTDALNNNIQMFDSAGNLLLRFGTMGLHSGQFRLPAGIYISADNEIWVADSINRRIQQFAYVGEN